MSLQELFDNRPCIKCGHCCTEKICAHGKWNSFKKQCHFLTKDLECGKYKQIVMVEAKWPVHMRTMKKGCVSPSFNEMRRKRIAKILKV